MHTIVLQSLNRLSPEYGDGSKIAPCLSRLSSSAFSEFCNDVRGDFRSGDLSRVRKYGILDVEKVFKAWGWGEHMNIGIALDFQSYGHHAPFCIRRLIPPIDFFRQKDILFQVSAGNNNFFSSGAIVVYRH